MSSFIRMLRSGDWLTRERARRWGTCVLAVTLLAVIFLVATSDGRNDFQGRPLGTDFANVYAAGSYVLEGQAAAPFDWALQFARQKQIFGEQTQFYGWHYPPFFLFVAGALATMPYPLALALWQGVTLLLYLLVVRAILAVHLPLNGGGRSRNDREGGALGTATGPAPGAPRAPTFPSQGEARSGMWLLLALAFPAVLVNLGHGHNGFLTAALIGGGLVLLDRRPWIAGVLFGLLSYKPQFGLLIPLALIAGGRWRTFFSATATVAVLILATTLAFGMEVWRAFFESAHLTRIEVLEAGNTGWQKIQSVFSWVRMWGGGVPLAYAAQGAVTIAVAGAVAWLWRSDATFAVKAAALVIGAVLATPYSLDYDMMALAPAIAYLAAHGLRRGFAPWEKSALALLWTVPLAARSIAEYALVPIGPWAMFLAFALVLRRTRSEAADFAPGGVQPSR